MPVIRALGEDLRTSTRWPALDGVRGVAVIAVVAYHGLRLAELGAGADADASLQLWWWPTGTARFALDAFFVLSGFLVVGSWTALRRLHGRGPAVREYARRRAARILPAYWVSLAVLLPLAAPHLLASPRDLGLLASVQQYLRPGLPAEVNVVYWSLTTEVHFYVLAPLLALVLARFGGWRVVVCGVAVTVAWRWWTPGGAAQSLVLGRVEQFALGAAAADLVRQHERGGQSRLVAALGRRGVGAVIAALLLALGVYQGAVIDGAGLGFLSHLLHPAVAIVVAAGFVRVLTREERSWLEHPALRLAGLVSYSVYLFHFPVLEHGLAALGADAGSAPGARRAVASVLLLGAASFVVGAVSYAAVERPFLRGRKPSRPAATPPEIDLRDGARERRFRQPSGV